ncbi:MAG: PAS domain S-box protein [Actinomycetota bacterium]
MEARFQNILDGAPDAIVGVDLEGRIRLVNAQTERLFGYQRQEVLGEPLEILLSEDGTEVYRSKTFTDPATRRVRGGFDLEGRRADGSTVPVNVTLSSVDTEAGQIILGAFRDVSERQRTEKALRAFVANAAHELRTPLTTISGLASILATRRGQLTEEQLIHPLWIRRLPGARSQRGIGNRSSRGGIRHVAHRWPAPSTVHGSGPRS